MQRGVLTLTDGYDTEYFCKKGKVPPSENGQDGTGSDGNNSNNGGVIGDGADVTLTFRTQGGREINPITAPAGSSVAVPTPEYDGYIFQGWYLSSAYLPSEKFESATMPNKNTTLWAKWEKKPDEYKNDYLTAKNFVRWDDTEYSFSGEKMMIRYTSDQYKSGASYNLNTNIEAKSGYNIMWYQDEDCTIAIGTQKDNISYGNNIYYATIVDAKNGQFVEQYMINIYLRHDYTYTYYPYAPNFTLAGEIQACYTERVIEDDTTHAPQAPNNGYTFVRWVTENRYGDFTEYNYNTPADGNRTFYAEWQSISLTVNTGENATLLAGDSTTVTFTPYSSSSIGVIPTTETQVFNGYYVGNTCYFDENGQLVKSLPASALGSLEARYGDTSDDYLKFVYDIDGYHVSLKLLPTYETKIVIPFSYSGRRVVGIADNAFKDAATLTGITVPASVTGIGQGAFAGCSATIAWSGTPSIETIGESAFSRYQGTSLTIPDSVTSIGSYAFYNCTGLTSVTIGNSVASIGEYAFYNCTGLTSVIIPNSVTSIGSKAFYDCTGLTSAHIGTGVSTLPEGLFSKCSSLTSLTIPFVGSSASDTSFSKSALFGYIFGTISYTGGTATKQYYSSSSSSFATYYIPTSLKQVTVTGGNLLYAFYGCTGLTSVTIGDGVTSIGSNAFYGCTGLTSVTIGNGVTSIRDDAFFGCTALTSVHISDFATWYSIDFYNNDSNPMYYAKHLYLNNDEIEIRRDLQIPDGVTRIGNYALAYTCFTSITIPDSVTSIGSYAFYNCTGLTSVTIGNSVASIGEYAFYNCTGLTSVTIGNSVTSIGSSAFRYCTGLTSVTIPNSVTSIGRYAFEQCTGLISVTIGSGVTSIGDSAFYYCKKLVEVYNLSSLTVTAGSGSSNGYVGANAIVVHASLDEESILHTTSDGYVFWLDGENVWLMGYIGTDTALSLPENYEGKVYSIYRYAFIDCTKLTSATIPNSVTSIGSYAFYGCSKLVEVYNLSSLSLTAGSSDNGYVAYYAKNVYTPEKGNSKLSTDKNGYIFYEDGDTAYLMGYIGDKTSLILPEKSPTGKQYAIYQYAFIGRTDLSSVIIPDSVTSIERYAFKNCLGLASVTIGNSVTSIGSDVFYNTSYYNDGCNWDNGVLYIGHHLIKAKTTLSGAYQIKEGTLTVSGSAFYNCTMGLTSVTIPNSVKSIGDFAFYRCSKLTSVTIGTSVTSIGIYAFEQCTGLTSVTIPNSVTSIGAYAFHNCANLKSVTFAKTSGWYVTEDSTATSGTSINVATSSYNATNLVTNSSGYYCGYYWKRNV